jgi:hypothetical protein
MFLYKLINNSFNCSQLLENINFRIYTRNKEIFLIQHKNEFHVTPIYLKFIRMQYFYLMYSYSESKAIGVAYFIKRLTLFT